MLLGVEEVKLCAHKPTHAHTHTHKCTQVLNVESETSGCVQEYTHRVLGFMLQSCSGLAIDVAPVQKRN